MPAEVWVLDTHIWIRVLSGDSVLQQEFFVSNLEARGQSGGLRLAAISLWETAMLVSKGRLRLEAPVQDWMLMGLKMRGLELVPLTAEIATESCFLPGEFHGDPADRLIVATTRRLGATLVTLDRAILEYGSAGWVSVFNPLPQFLTKTGTG